MLTVEQMKDHSLVTATSPRRMKRLKPKFSFICPKVGSTV